MFSAPTRSAWSVYPQRTHWNFSCVGRFSSATCPQSLRGQVREELRGSTGISLRPALSALCARMPRNTPQPASWMVLFSPAFAAAPFGRNAPALPGSGLGCGARTLVAVPNPWRATLIRSGAPTSYSGDYRRGGLVRVILPLAAHLAMQRGDLLHRTAMPGGSVVPRAPGERRPRALGVGEGIGGALAVPGVRLVLALGCGEEVGYAHVDTGHRTASMECTFGGLIGTRSSS